MCAEHSRIRRDIIKGDPAKHEIEQGRPRTEVSLLCYSFANAAVVEMETLFFFLASTVRTANVFQVTHLIRIPLPITILIRPLAHIMLCCLSLTIPHWLCFIQAESNRVVNQQNAR